jgi:uncharacterized cupredoxin-like copper-binding protein
MRRWYLGPLPFAIVAAALVLGWSGSPHHPSDQQTISIHFSSFEPNEVTVRAGEPITFELRNEDPIEHEWIVGDEQVHQAHRLGTEPYHDEIPTEVTIPAFETKTTVVTFDKPGEYAFICHLLGHEAYGMRGVVRVVE